MLDSIQSAIEDLKQGKMIVVVDDENRENEGDLLMVAEFANPQAVNFMAMYGRGLICAPMTQSRADELHLSLMADYNDCPYGTAFTVSVDAKNDTTTGISAGDRSKTLKGLANSKFSADDFMRPGHMFPLIAKPGGVLEREGHTEAAVDLAKLASAEPVGVICEILNEDGTMARLPELKVFAQKHDLKLISIEDLVKFLKKQ
ncbi:3,4-dihydroxy-2-butanone-4-phosphate synthase [Lentisphaera profundi]|uniref:3,4-dihydroxy-2-butanone 4-phosphate synthase n=1 Tax=Lentisphaera profundi TaxID=1658616 RepID=A0ABY7VQQ2_9BACT|nr:3,4-dihydroxy-2-butanone-4-phosphate synthase [Lentisphaera profundi]WDE96166.1 3,4-dihydroxy-2-butanone-4-phosphate synthase [Lentisphaera profundi]